jgi:hypothetical protein
MNQDLNSLIERIERLEASLYNLRLMYRPPEREEHVSITEYLDEVDKRIEILEDANNNRDS